MRRLLLSLAAAFAAVAVLLAVSGGGRATVGGFRISARSPIIPIALATVCAIMWFALARRSNQISSDLEFAWSTIDRRGRVLIALVALTSGLTAAIFSTNSASGADASGYLSQAELWTSGKPMVHDDLGITLAALDNVFLTTPLGWRPAMSLMPVLQVPSYPPGLPMLMALPHWIAGTAGAAFVVPICAAIAVGSVGAIAVVMAGGAAGLIAAIAIATTPVFLFQSVQPMSDVPVTAAWMVCWLLLIRGATPSGLAAGIACAIAVLIRPNLAPLAAIPFLYVLSISRRQAWRLAIPVAVAAVVLAFLQDLWYGSPLRSGYGGAAELFALSNAGPNLSRYFGWLIETSPAMLLSIGGAFVLRKRRDTQALTVFAVLVLAAYLVYAVFDDWSYLRFLLPALAVAAVFVAVLICDIVQKLPMQLKAMAFVSFVSLVLPFGIYEARTRDTFKLADQQQRVAQIANALAERSAPGDVMLSGEQSGSMRYYTKREIVRWDELRSDQWDRLLSMLSSDKRAAWIVLDAFEEPLFREKFKNNSGGLLDWPPAIDAGDTHRTRAWRLGDRSRFAAGETVTTERIR